MSEMVEVINSVGFPIFAVIALFWQNTEMRKMFDNEQKDLQKTISENTLVLTKLSVSLDRAIEDKKEVL
jgi:hypothetical protein